jgi:hypothetical protein
MSGMTIEPGMIVLLDGKLAEVIGVAQQPTAILRYVRDEDTPRCVCGLRQDRDEHYVIGSLLWRERVRPVETIS